MNRDALMTVAITVVALALLFHHSPPQQIIQTDTPSASPVVAETSASPKMAVAARVSPPVASRTPTFPAGFMRGRVTAGVTAAKFPQKRTMRLSDAFSLSQLEAAKAKAQAEHKPLGFLMVWGQFFGEEADTRSGGGAPGLAHFYRAFNSNLVLVFVRHETELGSVPDAVKQGFNGPDEGGFAPNMAVVDATATEFIVEIPYGGNDSNGAKRDQVFGAGAVKIDQWLTTHPYAVAATLAKP